MARLGARTIRYETRPCVVAGAAIGAGCSYIFTRPFAQKHELTVVPVSDGRHFGIAASFRL